MTLDDCVRGSADQSAIKEMYMQLPFSTSGLNLAQSHSFPNLVKPWTGIRVSLPLTTVKSIEERQ